MKKLENIQKSKKHFKKVGQYPNNGKILKKFYENWKNP